MTNELYHHGIPGQKWGVRNGPPYPLNKGTVTAIRKKSTEKNDASFKQKREHLGLSSRQKKVLKIGAIAAAAALATYGAYKLGYLDGVQEKGKEVFGSFLDKFEMERLGISSSNNFQRLKRPETVEEVLSKVNPTRSSNNCYNCVASTVARLCGYDVTAKGDTRDGKGYPFDDLCRAFGLNPYDGKDVSRLHNANVSHIERVISKRYSEGDIGAIALEWNDTYKRMYGVDLSESAAHVLNWVVRDGKVELIDSQVGVGNDRCRKILEKFISSEKEVSIAKFGNMTDGLGTAIDNIASFIDSRK